MVLVDFQSTNTNCTSHQSIGKGPRTSKNPSPAPGKSLLEMLQSAEVQASDLLSRHKDDDRCFNLLHTIQNAQRAFHEFEKNAKESKTAVVQLEESGRNAEEDIKHEKYEKLKNKLLEVTEDMQITKALLLLKNVELNVDVKNPSKNSSTKKKQKTGEISEISEINGCNVPEKYSISGNFRELKDLMKLRNRVKLLELCCSDLKKSMVEFNYLIPDMFESNFVKIKTRLHSEKLRRRGLEQKLSKLDALFSI